MHSLLDWICLRWKGGAIQTEVVRDSRNTQVRTCHFCLQLSMIQIDFGCRLRITILTTTATETGHVWQGRGATHPASILTFQDDSVPMEPPKFPAVFFSLHGLWWVIGRDRGLRLRSGYQNRYVIWPSHGGIFAWSVDDSLIRGKTRFGRLEWNYGKRVARWCSPIANQVINFLPTWWAHFSLAKATV